MTESAKSLWDAVDIEINDWLGDGAESYCLTDKIVEEVRGNYIAMNLVNRIGLKRRIGKVLKAKGYSETSTSPPTWVKSPPVKAVKEEPECYHAVLKCPGCGRMHPRWEACLGMCECGVLSRDFVPMALLATAPEPPQWVKDQYLTLHQAITIIEQQYPDIMKVAVQ